MPVAIFRQDRGGVNERWGLEVGTEFMTLLAPAGQVVARWTPANASQCITFPSFSKSIKHTGFHVAQRGTYQFAIDPATLKKVRNFVNVGIVSDGPAAIQKVLLIALGTTALGFLMLCVGLVSLLLMFHHTKISEPNIGVPYAAGFLTVILGFAGICAGIYSFFHYLKLRRLAKKN